MNRILYIQYTNPAGYPPLQHSSLILAEAGWKVMFVGTGAAGANSLEFPSHPNIAVKRMPFREAGWQQKLHYLRFCLWVLWTILSWRPRWVYASDPLSCPVALLLTWAPGTRVLYHEHDAPDSTGSRLSNLVSRTRRALAPRAGLCILPNEKRLQKFEVELGPLRRSACVWNCPASNEVVNAPRNTATHPIWLLYHGSIVPDRLPATVLDALSFLPDRVMLRVVGYETVGSRGYTAQLKHRAGTLGLNDRVEFLNTVPQRADLLRITLKSDIGLALMPNVPSDWNCETMTGASNKAFDYMACGLALVVTDLPDWREMFIEPGYARGCDPEDPRSIAAAIQYLIETPGRMRAMGESGRKRILSDWNYENAFQPVMEHMSGAPAANPVGTRQRVENAS